MDTQSVPVTFRMRDRSGCCHEDTILWHGSGNIVRDTLQTDNWSGNTDLGGVAYVDFAGEALEYVSITYGQTGTPIVEASDQFRVFLTKRRESYLLTRQFAACDTLAEAVDIVRSMFANPREFQASITVVCPAGNANVQDNDSAAFLAYDSELAFEANGDRDRAAENACYAKHGLIRCPTCDGEGGFVDAGPSEGCSEYGVAWVPCQTCVGDGSIPINSLVQV